MAKALINIRKNINNFREGIFISQSHINKISKALFIDIVSWSISDKRKQWADMDLKKKTEEKKLIVLQDFSINR